MASSSSAPPTLPSSTSNVSHRLQAIHDLVQALATNYATGGFYLHPGLEFGTSPNDPSSPGIAARVTQPIPKGTVLLIIPAGECINYENITASLSTGQEIQLTPTSGHGKPISLAKIVKQIQVKCNDEIHGVQVEDIALMVLIMYLLSKQHGTEATTNIDSSKPRPPPPPPQDGTTTGSRCSHHLMPPTWPTPWDVAEQFEWSDHDVKELQGTYAECLFSLQQNAKGQTMEEVLIPILEQANVIHHFCAPASFFVTANDQAVEAITEQKEDDDKIPYAALWKTFKYAFHIVQSRCHDGLPGGKSADLVPLIDLFDGLPGTSGDINIHLECNPWSAIAKNIDPLLPPEQNQCDPSMTCLGIYALRDIAANEPLYISYGNIAPSVFLYKYGVVPQQYMVEPLLPVDVVHLGFPPTMAPRADDTARIQGLAMHGYPTTPEEIEQTFWFTLDPNDLAKWQIPLQGGLGQDTPSYENGEPIMFRNMRQFIMVALIATDADILHFLENNRIRGVFELQEIGRHMLQVMDYNLDRLANKEANNQSELKSCNADNTAVGLTNNKRTATLARILYRDALAQWRHVLCRYYKIRSAVDDSLALREFLNLDGTTNSGHPDCLTGGGCSVCGCTIHLQTCARCRQVWYCSRNHQKSAWKFHKPVCIPVGMQAAAVVSDAKAGGEK